MTHDINGDWRLAVIVLMIFAVTIGILAWRHYHGK